ncbi:hypothetical protein AV540_03035 [Brevibacillus parabrevis]|uniref:DMT family transporter n=1 Tax=Brevibacillus parabrevis TaxID=54914 RepID=UPI0007B17C3D|nr:DMT family transporter [Brevibacillus parabrevis]KZE40851.1 hypothetical protein AV540_03035 [Brevibacillus parabrevis]
MGIAFPIGKFGLAYAPPLSLMGIGYILAGELLALIVMKKPLPRKQAAAASVDNRIAAVHRRHGMCVLGCAIGFVVVFLTFGFHLDIQPGTFICLMGAVSFAIATLLIKRWGNAYHLDVLSAYQMLVGEIGLMTVSSFTEHPYFIFTVTSLSVVLCLIILCSIVQFSVWYSFLQKGDPGKTSSFLFLAPLFGVLSSWLLRGRTGEMVCRVRWGFDMRGCILMLV